MKKIEPTSNNKLDNYWAVVDADGNMRCSCGSELIKLDEHTYKCAGGWPIYRFEDGSVFIDKFGSLMIKTSDHDGEQDEEN